MNLIVIPDACIVKGPHKIKGNKFHIRGCALAEIKTMLLICIPQIRKKLHIHDRCNNPLQGSELRVDSQGEKHQEEENRPELGSRELVDGFCEDDEGKACARCCL